MTPKKKKQKQKRQRREPVEIIGIKKATALQPKARTKRSKYDEIVDAATRLKPGEVLEISIDPDVDQDIARNRISAVIRRKAIPQTNYHLKIRMTENDTVGIYCSHRRE